MQQDVLFEDLAGLIKRIANHLVHIGPDRLGDIRQELHGIKSLLAFVSASLEAEAHDLELLAIADPPDFFSKIAAFLETIAQLCAEHKYKSHSIELGLTDTREQSTNSAQQPIPPLIIEPLIWDVANALDIADSSNKFNYIIRVLIDPAEQMPRARVGLLIRRLETHAILLASDAWYWQSGEASWAHGSVPAEAEVVFFRAVVLTDQTQSDLYRLLDMDGIHRILIGTSKIQARAFELLPNELGLNYRLQRQSAVLAARRPAAKPTVELLADHGINILPRLEQWQQYTLQQAQRQNRLVMLVQIFEGQNLSATMLDTLSRAVVQLIRNAIRHGVQSPDLRQRLGKDPIGVLSLMGWYDENSWNCAFDDDGPGIDAITVAKHAGLEPDSIPSTQELQAILSREGISLVVNPDVHAGQGIGLSVVHAVMNNELSGTWTLRTHKGQGTGVLCTIPRTLFSLHFVVLAWQGFEFAVPLCQVRGVKSIEKRFISQINGKYHMSIGAMELAVAQPWIIYAPNLKGIESLWPGDLVQVVLLGSDDGVSVSCVCSAIGDVEQALVPLHAEAVYSNRSGTWLPLFEV